MDQKGFRTYPYSVFANTLVRVWLFICMCREVDNRFYFVLNFRLNFFFTEKYNDTRMTSLCESISVCLLAELCAYAVLTFEQFFKSPSATFRPHSTFIKKHSMWKSSKESAHPCCLVSSVLKIRSSISTISPSARTQKKNTHTLRIWPVSENIQHNHCDYFVC